MNSFDIVYQELNKDGMKVDVMRKRKDGTMEQASARELASLGTKARVASTAGLLKKLSPEEKLTWATETKDEANQLYSQHKYAEAMEMYVEALAGSDFGKKKTTTKFAEGGAGSREQSHADGNIDTLIIPVLCNLAACCIQIEEWGKAISFAQQALLLRPKCTKALMRQGVGFLKAGEFELALDSLKSAYKYSQSDRATHRSTNLEDRSKTCVDGTDIGDAAAGTTVDDDDFQIDDESTCYQSDPTVTKNELQAITLSETDFARLPRLIHQAKLGVRKQKEYYKKQKKSLAKAFSSGITSYCDQDSGVTLLTPTITVFHRGDYVDEDKLSVSSSAAVCDATNSKSAPADASATALSSTAALIGSPSEADCKRAAMLDRLKAKSITGIKAKQVQTGVDAKTVLATAVPSVSSPISTSSPACSTGDDDDDDEYYENDTNIATKAKEKKKAMLKPMTVVELLSFILDMIFCWLRRLFSGRVKTS